MSEIIKVNKEDIILIFEYNQKEYCAFKILEEEKEKTYFALVTKIDEKNKVLTSISESEIEEVIKEYKKNIEIFNFDDDIEGDKNND